MIYETYIEEQELRHEQYYTNKLTNLLNETYFHVFIFIMFQQIQVIHRNHCYHLSWGQQV